MHSDQFNKTKHTDVTECTVQLYLQIMLMYEDKQAIESQQTDCASFFFLHKIQQVMFVNTICSTPHARVFVHL